MWFNDDDYEDDTPSSASTTPASTPVVAAAAAAAAAAVVASNVSSTNNADSANSANAAINANTASASPVDQPLAAAAALAAGSSNGPLTSMTSAGANSGFNQQNLVTSTSGNDHGASNEVLSMAELASSKDCNVRFLKSRLLNLKSLFSDKLSESRNMNPTVRLAPVQNNTKKVIIEFYRRTKNIKNDQKGLKRPKIVQKGNHFSF